MANNIPFPSPDFAKIKKLYSGFLKEVRKKLIFTVSVFVVSMFGGFVFYEQIISFLIKILSLNEINIVFTSPFQFINLAISVGIATGLIIMFPILIFQILSFLRPALKMTKFEKLE